MNKNFFLILEQVSNVKIKVILILQKVACIINHGKNLRINI